MGGSVFAMFHLDYLSCFLTILATILLARKSWIGLLVAIVNSLIVCAIGLRTSQLGFIPANIFCICVYAFSMRPWLKEQIQTNRDQALRQDSGSVADGPRMRPAMRHRTAAGIRRFPNDLGKSPAIKTTVDGFIYHDPTQFHDYFVANLATLPWYLVADGKLVEETLARTTAKLDMTAFESSVPALAYGQARDVLIAQAIAALSDAQRGK